MPKVTTNELSYPIEPLLAAVPIRASSRVPRPPRRHLPRSDWVETSCMPSLTGYPASSHAPLEWPFDFQAEDVTMAPPTSDATRAAVHFKTEPQTVRGATVAYGRNPSAFPQVEHGAPSAENQVRIEEVTAAAPATPGITLPRLDTNVPILGNIGLQMDVETNREVQNLRSSPVRAMGQEEERFQMETAVQAIDSLNIRIHKLQRTEQRLKKQLKDEKERLKNSKSDAEGALNLLVLAEEKVCEVESMMAVLKQDVDRYRTWWLTEYYSLKAVINLLPRQNKNDVIQIAEAAHARFAFFSRA